MIYLLSSKGRAADENMHKQGVSNNTFLQGPIGQRLPRAVLNHANKITAPHCNALFDDP